MSYTTLKKSLLFCRSIHSKSIRLKSTGIANLAGCSQTIASEKNIRTIDKLKQNQFQKNFLEKKTDNGNKIRTETAISSFLFSNENNPDSFGSLSEDWKMHEQLKAMPVEEDDVVETEFLNNREGKTRLTINQYGRIIKKFLSENKITLALDVLDTRMLKIDKVKPENYIYNLLIGACGQVGYTKKAFKLYNQMKERGLKVTGHTYTGLFNACANSPYPEDGLKRARHLQGLMLEKAVLMNPTIYHAMIKAFGRCGDLETSFMLVDEMVEKKIRVLEDTFNFLLQACITDKTSGFRHALLVWRKMIEKRIRPSLYSFNLLLRCSRDCGLGDEVATQQVIQVLLHSGQIRSQRVAVNAGSDNKSEAINSLVSIHEETGSLPNLIDQHPTMGSIVAVTNVVLPEHRLMLMGGSKGILEQMRIYGVKPDIKTFTQLLDQLPPTFEDEQKLVEAVKQFGVTLDVDFCNMLIRKRCLRKDYEDAKDVLKIINEENLRPTIMTFGVLAMACQSISSAKQLLQDIDKVGYRPNIEIFGTLLKNACYSRNCNFVMEILKTLEEEEDVKPNEMFLKHIDNFYNFITNSSSSTASDNFRKQHFIEYYNVWRQKVQPDAPPHPWDQFRTPHLEQKDLELMNTGMVKYAK